MTKTLSMVSHKNYNLRANEGFMIFFTSKLIPCFVDGFTLTLKSHSIAYLLNVSEYILDFGPWRWSALNMGFVDKWPSRMQGQWFSWSWAGMQKCSVRSQKSIFFYGGLPLLKSTSPEKFVGGGVFNIRRTPIAHPMTCYFVLIKDGKFRNCTAYNTIPPWLLPRTCFLPRCKYFAKVRPNILCLLGAPPIAEPPFFASPNLKYR